jgi:outer membrane protein assembly factor BamB
MSEGSWWKSGFGLRVATLVLPPLGLVLLWKSGGSIGRKLFGSLGVVFYSVLYVAALCWLLVRYDGLKVEWRGGYLPALTSHVTGPDYKRLESHRAKQQAIPTATPALTNQSAYWTGFRGPNRDGRYDELPIETHWPPNGLQLLWRQPCGGGYASFAIANGVAFTIEQRRDQEVIGAYSLNTGREVWTYSWKGLFGEPMGGDGPRATPAWSEGRIFALGAVGDLKCVDAETGKLVWSHNIAAETGAAIPTYGFSTSPLVIQEKLLVVSGAGRGRSVLCYDKADGKLLWSALDDVTGYASPALFTISGQAQLVICCETRTVGLNPDDGGVLWSYPWRVLNNQLPIAQPVQLATNRFLLSGGYFTGSEAVEIVKANSNFTARTVWKTKNLKNKFTSSIVYEGYIYGLDEDILTCLDSNSGERKWKGGRYGYGQIALASGHIIILTGDGEIALVKATPEKPDERARFQAITGKTWNHPAFAQAKLLVRNGAEMACFSLEHAQSH